MTVLHPAEDCENSEVGSSFIEQADNLWSSPFLMFNLNPPLSFKSSKQ